MIKSLPCKSWTVSIFLSYPPTERLYGRWTERNGNAEYLGCQTRAFVSFSKYCDFLWSVWLCRYYQEHLLYFSKQDLKLSILIVLGQICQKPSLVMIIHHFAMNFVFSHKAQTLTKFTIFYLCKLKFWIFIFLQKFGSTCKMFPNWSLCSKQTIVSAIP